jgi:glycosyltransferase involved in cell wall biosynthesis
MGPKADIAQAGHKFLLFMESSKRLFFFAATLGQGGAEKQFYYIVKELSALGFAVTVGCFEKNEFWQGPIEALGVKVVHLDAVGKLSRLKQVFKLLKSLQPKLVFSMHFYSNFYVAMPARVLGIKAVGSIRNNGYYELHNLGRLLAGVCYYTPHLILANSWHGAANMKKIFPLGGQAKILNNAIDTSAYKQVAFDTIPEEPVLLLIARLIPLKRAKLFLQLLVMLHAKGLRVKGIVVGYGPEEESLKDFAAKNLQPDGILFTGRQSDVRPWLEQAFALVSTSSHEGTSNVYLEAMASGLPRLALRFPGIEGLIKDEENGLLFNNIDEMAAGCGRILDDLSLHRRISDNGRKTVEDFFDSKSIARQFIALTNI